MWPFESVRRHGAVQRRSDTSSVGRRSSRPAIIASLAVSAIVLAACASASAPAQGAALDTTRDSQSGAFGPVAGAANPEPSAAASTGPGAPADALPDVNLIIRTGTMTVEVPSIDPALLRARTAIVGLGGYISASDQANDGDRTIASVTYRFPSARWEDAQAAIRDVATKILSAKTGSSEVTGQVLDIGARISNLRATEQALQAIMAKATKISDILEVQNQLTDVQGQIEELSTQESHLRDQASLATLTVLFQTPAVAVVNEVSKGWDIGAELDKAAAQLLSVGQVLATVGVWLVIVGLPVFGGTIVLLLIAAFIIRRLARLMAPWFGRYATSTDVTGGPSA